MDQYVNSYSKLTSFSFRTTLRNSAGSMLYAANKKNVRKLLSVPKVQIIEMHYLFPDEEKKFRLLLQYLVDTGHKFISFSDAIALIENGKIDRPYIAFSFDDGYANCVAASRILREFGANAIFYLNTNIVGETDYAKIARHCRVRINKPAVKFMNWQEVDMLLRQGHEIGGHTKSHFRMTDLNHDQIAEEVVEDKQKIEKMCGRCDHFAWPYGTRSDITKVGLDTVYSAGYKSCSSAVRGVHLSSRGQRCFINRDHVIAGWPLSHTKYMLARSVRISETNSTEWQF